MMRYQRVSPDCVPLASNGKTPNVGTTNQTPPPPQPSSTATTNPIASSSSSFEPNKALRFRSPSRTPEHNNNGLQESSPSDMLLQWGHRKRPRASRTEIRAPTDDSSSSSSAQARQQHQRQQNHPLKSHRSLVGPASMPPPPPPPPPTVPPSSSNGRARKEAPGSLLNRNLDDRSGPATGSSPPRNSVGNARVQSRSTAGNKRSPPPEKSDRKVSPSARTPNGSAQADRTDHHVDSASLRHHHHHHHHDHEAANNVKEEKTSTELLEWPKVQIPLSRKEKEEDFLAMRGSKLPQRPKKRPKNVERALQYVFPGTWLVDVTRNRYEVREKKCVKKQKRRGLKGMESVDSDSE